MTRHHRAVFAALIGGLMFGCADAGGRAEPACDRDVVAHVGRVVVSAGDVEEVRGFVQPPPTHAEAARLAVAATRVYVEEHPAAEKPGMSARLAIYKEKGGGGRAPQLPVRWNECARERSGVP